MNESELVEWIRASDPKHSGAELYKISGPMLQHFRRFAALVANAEREACINKIEAELDHALINDLRLAARFGQLKGDRAVRISAIKAALGWISDRGRSSPVRVHGQAIGGAMTEEEIVEVERWVAEQIRSMRND